MVDYKSGMEMGVGRDEEHWYDEWCAHVKASNEIYGKVDSSSPTVPSGTESQDTPLQEPNPALIYRSMSEQLNTAIGPEHDIKRLMLLISVDPAFEGIKKMAAWFKSCEIYVEPFFVAVANYDDMCKEKGKNLNKVELVSLFALMFNRLARAFLFAFGDEVLGRELEELSPFVKRNMCKYETSVRGQYYCEDVVIDTLRLISIFAKSQLNGYEVDKYYNDIVLIGLLPES